MCKMTQQKQMDIFTDLTHKDVNLMTHAWNLENDLQEPHNTAETLKSDAHGWDTLVVAMVIGL